MNSIQRLTLAFKKQQWAYQKKKGYRAHYSAWVSPTVAEVFQPTLAKLILADSAPPLQAQPVEFQRALAPPCSIDFLM
jgi:hypothetical protein